MKLIKLLLGVPVVYLIFLCSGVGFTGCAKDISTIHDTTIKTVTDTLRDTLTVTIHDTLNTCDCNLTDGLIAYYNFNLGNLNDSSGYGNTIYPIRVLRLQRTGLEGPIMPIHSTE